MTSESIPEGRQYAPCVYVNYVIFNFQTEHAFSIAITHLFKFYTGTGIWYEMEIHITYDLNRLLTEL
jgi:hypothetical protein